MWARVTASDLLRSPEPPVRRHLSCASPRHLLFALRRENRMAMEPDPSPDGPTSEQAAEVAGFVERVECPSRSPGETVKLVDGRFRVTRVQVTTHGRCYFGVWLDED